MIAYRRCMYIDSQSRECNTYFGVKDDEDQTLCPLHAGVLGPRTASVSETTKVDYVNFMNESANEARALINPDKPLDLDELDLRLANLEAEIEKFKSKASAYRGVRADHIHKLTEEQRRELRKIKVPPAGARGNGDAKRPPQTQENLENAALNKLVKTMMGLGKSEIEATKSAKQILGLD